MIEVISETTPKARKEYDCEACDWFGETAINSQGEFSVSELRIIALAKRHKGKIQKGDKYLKQVNKYEGSVYTFRAIPEMHKLCLKYGLYPEL